MSSKRLAQAISIITSPLLWLPILYVIVLINSNLTPTQLKIIAPTVLLLQVIIPISYVFIAKARGQVESMDLDKRSERIPLYHLVLVTTIVSLIVIFLYGSSFMINLTLTFFVIAIILFLINQKTKVSLHATINTVAVILINYFYAWQYLWLIIIIPAVFWARLKLKKHTPNQLLIGSIVSGSILLLSLKLLG